LYGRFHETCFIEKNVSVIFLDSLFVSFKSLSKVIIMRKRKQLHDDVRGNLHDEAACKGFENIFFTFYCLLSNNFFLYFFSLKENRCNISIEIFYFFVLKQKSNKKIQGSREKAKISLVPLQRRKLTINNKSFPIYD